jgi:hypothetical protein
VANISWNQPSAVNVAFGQAQNTTFGLKRDARSNRRKDLDMANEKKGSTDRDDDKRQGSGSGRGGSSSQGSSQGSKSGSKSGQTGQDDRRTSDSR